MSAAFALKIAERRDRRMAARLVHRAQEAFEAGDRVGFETYSSAASFRLEVDGFGLTPPELLRALRRALLLILVVVLASGCVLHAEGSDDSTPPAAAAAPCASSDAGAPPMADAPPDAAPAADSGPAPVDSDAGVVIDQAVPTADGAGRVRVYLFGVGLASVVDVKVQGVSVPFTAIDDGELSFDLGADAATYAVGVYQAADLEVATATVTVTP